MALRAPAPSSGITWSGSLTVLDWERVR